MKNRNSIPESINPRSGLSLLETMMAFSLAAMLLSPVVGLMHTTREVWELGDSDRARMNSLLGTLRHVSHTCRKAKSISELESRKNRPAVLQIENRNGTIERWTHNRKAATVQFASAGEAGLLADHIATLRFEGFTRDGKLTRSPHLIHSIRCTAAVMLKTGPDNLRTASCEVSLRHAD